MITRNEILFAEDFLDTLRYLGVKQMPFMTRAYERGIEKAGEVLKENFSEEYEKVSTLFSRKAISGEYQRMYDAMQLKINTSKDVAIEAPYFKTLHLKPQTNFSDKPTEALEITARAFCQEVGLETRNFR